MKAFGFPFFCSLFIISCNKIPSQNEVNQAFLPYTMIYPFSDKIQKETGLVLCANGINAGHRPSYHMKHGINDFMVGFVSKKNKEDNVTLESARNLIIFVTENFLSEINTNSELKCNLNIYPFVSNLLDISIHFEDEKLVDIGQGVAVVRLSKGKIQYEGYKIEKYPDRCPVEGKHYLLFEENYAEALDIVKKTGNLKIIVGNS